MLSYLINLFWIVLSALLSIALVLGILLFVAMAIYLAFKDMEKACQSDVDRNPVSNNQPYDEVQCAAQSTVNRTNRKRRRCSDIYTDAY